MCTAHQKGKQIWAAPDNQPEGGKGMEKGKEKALGVNHPETLASVSNLGILLYEQGKPAEAEPLLRRAF